MENGKPLATDVTLAQKQDSAFTVTPRYWVKAAKPRHILDPAEVMGEDYPSETFRVLKKNELKAFGEYRTQRLVLAAWDRLESGDLH